MTTEHEALARAQERANATGKPWAVRRYCGDWTFHEWRDEGSQADCQHWACQRIDPAPAPSGASGSSHSAMGDALNAPDAAERIAWLKKHAPAPQFACGVCGEPTAWIEAGLCALCEEAVQRVRAKRPAPAPSEAEATWWTDERHREARRLCDRVQEIQHDLYEKSAAILCSIAHTLPNALDEIERLRAVAASKAPAPPAPLARDMTTQGENVSDIEVGDRVTVLSNRENASDKSFQGSVLVVQFIEEPFMVVRGGYSDRPSVIDTRAMVLRRVSDGCADAVLDAEGRKP